MSEGHKPISDIGKPCSRFLSDTKDMWSEDLIWQAERGAELGRAHCDCPGYFHVLWSLLRASQRVSGIEDEHSVLSRALTPLVKTPTRILIGGAADPGQLCLIRRAAGDAVPDITISERCAAPVSLIREFASAKGISCCVLHSDIFDLDDKPQWDLVFLHYTAAHVLPQRRRLFFKKLSQVLHPGGSIISVDMIGEPIQEHLQEEYEKVLYTRTLAALKASQLQCNFRDVGLEDMVRAYAAERWRRRLCYPTRNSLDDALAWAGFGQIERIDTGRIRTVKSANSRVIDLYPTSIVTAKLI